MREIKFRAYDDRRKRTFEVAAFSQIWFDEENAADEWISEWEYGDSWKLKRTLFHSWITLMQYTWLKDKNWKEIYEGDIVGVEDEMGEMYWQDQSGNKNTYADCWIGEVEFYEWLWYICGEVHNALYDVKEVNYISVIWNIYENPELLQPKWTNSPSP